MMEAELADKAFGLFELGAVVTVLIFALLIALYVCKVLYDRNTHLADKMLSTLVEVNKVLVELRDEIRFVNRS